jgi:hypothetical protein
LVTRFGEITIRRRLYQDERGNYHFLLDEYLGWASAQAATPSLKRSIVSLATTVPFRETSNILEGLTAGVLSSMTIHRLLQRVAQAAIEEESQAWRACFEEGRAPPSEDRRVPVLYVEADGVWVHLQREEKGHYEVKSAMAYEGWRRLPQQAERYALVNKRFYCHADRKIPFWEGASLEWSRIWDLSQLRLAVVNGDGAGWIDEGVEQFLKAVCQLDGFHLARACHQGWEGGGAIYQAIRTGRKEKAQRLIAESPLRTGKRAEKARGYVERHLERGADFRTQVETVEGAHGLGAMEGNEDKLIANRMKKRGMSWTVQGAQRMAKVLELEVNGKVESYCGRRQRPGGEIITPPQLTPRIACEGVDGNWLHATIPAFKGPHVSRPWVQRLRALVYDFYRLN